MWKQRILLWQSIIIGTVTGCCLPMAVPTITVADTLAEMPMGSQSDPNSINTSPRHEFQAIQPPPAIKIGVTVAGLCFIGAELWWFLFRKPNNTL